MGNGTWFYPLIALVLASAVLRVAGFPWGSAVFAVLALACLGMLFYGWRLSRRALAPLDEPAPRTRGETHRSRRMKLHETRYARRRSRLGLAFLGFAAIAGFFLLTEHRAHMLGAAPYVLLLLCLLLHFFGHRREPHDGERGEAKPGTGRDRP